MRQFLIFLLALRSLEAAFSQNDYAVNFERTTLEWFDNKTVIQPCSINTFKYNRSVAAFNVTLTLTEDLGDSLLCLAEAFKLYSNEYREFPMRYQFNFCQALQDNDYGLANSLKCGNFTGCPLKKGTYVMCNGVLDQSRFPPLIPSGSYKLKITSIYKSEPIYTFNVYYTIVYPVTKWRLG